VEQCDTYSGSLARFEQTPIKTFVGRTLEDFRQRLNAPDDASVRRAVETVVS
jgi:hypothetical protein